MIEKHDRKSRLGFIAATTALLATFAASAAPIPLYPLYREEDHLTFPDLSLTAVAYFAGAVTALLVLGRLSNHLGRRPIVLSSLGLAAAGSIILLDVSNVAPLILGRVLLGLACGLASSATTAFIVDTAPDHPSWLAAAVTSSAPMVGLTIGALGSGALIEYGSMPRTLPYLIVLAGLLASAILVTMSREAAPRQPGVLGSLRPTITLPKTSRALFPVATCTFVATWALGGFYQAFGPAMATDQLGSTNALVGAAVFSSMMAPTALGGPIAGRLSPANAQRIGMIAFTLSVGGILVSLWSGAVVAFLLASTLAATAQGVILTGSIRALVSPAGVSERAGVFSLIYATSYTGAAIPSFLAGQFSQTLSLLQIATGYGLLAATACAVTLIAARDPANSGETR
jgi:MFS family permease